MSRIIPPAPRGRRLAGLAALALPLLLAGSLTPPTPAAKPKTVVIKMTDDNKFIPAAATVAVGDTVVWVNAGQVPHTSTDTPGAAALTEHTVLPKGAKPWDSGVIMGDQRFSWVLTTPGNYTYVCLLHEANGMIGRLTVR